MTLVSGSRCEHAIRIGCRLVALAARQVPRDNSAQRIRSLTSSNFEQAIRDGVEKPAMSFWLSFGRGTTLSRNIPSSSARAGRGLLFIDGLATLDIPTEPTAALGDGLEHIHACPELSSKRLVGWVFPLNL